MSPHPIINHIPLLFSGVIFDFTIVFKTTIMIFYFLFIAVLSSKALAFMKIYY